MMGTMRRVWLTGLLLGTLVVVPACSGTSADQQDPKALEGVEWLLTGASVSSVDLGTVGITTSFDGERMGGFSGVNTYGGAYTAEADGSFSAGPLSSTLMAGPEPAMSAEQAYLKLVEGCNGYKVADGTLTLLQDGNEQLVFEVQKATELPGSKWTVTAYNNGTGGVQTVAIDSTLSIEFGTDGTVTGNSGVNTYNGPYEVMEAGIKIGPLATTKMAGPDELMKQEAAFIKALESCASWSVSRGQLEMRDGGSATQITAVAK